MRRERGFRLRFTVTVVPIVSVVSVVGSFFPAIDICTDRSLSLCQREVGVSRSSLEVLRLQVSGCASRLLWFLWLLLFLLLQVSGYRFQVARRGCCCFCCYYCYCCYRFQVSGFRLRFAVPMVTVVPIVSVVAVVRGLSTYALLRSNNCNISIKSVTRAPELMDESVFYNPVIPSGFLIFSHSPHLKLRVTGCAKWLLLLLLFLLFLLFRAYQRMRYCGRNNMGFSILAGSRPLYRLPT